MKMKWVEKPEHIWGDKYALLAGIIKKERAYVLGCARRNLIIFFDDGTDLARYLAIAKPEGNILVHSLLGNGWALDMRPRRNK